MDKLFLFGAVYSSHLFDCCLSHPENCQVPSVSDIWIPTAVTSLYSSSGHARASTCVVYTHTSKLAKSKSRPRYLYSESSVPIFIIYFVDFSVGNCYQIFFIKLKWRLLQQQQRLQFEIEIRKKDGLPPGGSSWASTQLREFTNSREEKKKTDFFIISNRTRRRQRGLVKNQDQQLNKFLRPMMSYTRQGNCRVLSSLFRFFFF